MASLALAFDILARDKNATRTFNNVGRAAESAGRKGKTFGSLMSGAAKIAAGALAAAGIGELIHGITGAVGDSIAEAREAQKVGRTTGAIIKATGGASKVSQKQVEALAGAISVKAGVDDEAIQSGANLLLTFKKVRNEAGKGNKVFDRATQAAVDLSAAGFGSVEGASKMLGKALNDPIKGISALGRAGVTFTADQKKQIRTLVDSGKTLEAQKIILGEVETQVGGVAAANASMGDKVKVAIGNIKESIGTALLPVLDKLGAWFLDKGLPALQRFGGWLQDKLWPALQRGYEAILPTLRSAFDKLKTGFSAVADFVQNRAIPAVQSFWGWLKNDLWPALKDGYEKIMPALKQAFDIIGGAFKSSGSDGAGFGDKLRAIGDIIVTYLIPFVAKVVQVWLPLWATQIRIVIEAVKLLWKGIQTLGTIVASVVSFILKRFADMADMWADVLSALGHVPGFGWATDAAKKLKNAADKADDVARAIDNIKRDVTIGVTFKATSGRIKVGNQTVNVGMRAGGGPVSAGRLYQVGDNPDGSWNSTTEVIAPRRPMRVLNQDQMRQELGTAAAAAGASTSSQVRLHPSDIAAIVEGIVRRPNVIGAGQFDAAMGATLR